MSAISELDAQIADRAIKVVRQLAYVAVERGALATDLGFELDAAAEKELGRRFHQLAGQARHIFDACDRDAALLAEAEVKAEADERDNRDWYVVNMLSRLTAEQKAGVACLICAEGFSGLAGIGRPSAVIDGHHTNVHCDPAVCTQALAARLSKEVPF